MNIVFADSFYESLKKINRHSTWWYKTYSFFRRDLPNFLKNIWFFRKELWSFRSWDYSFNLKLLSRSLEKTANTLEFYGNEIEEPRMKKVVKIKRVVEIIQSLDESNYIERAEKQLGELRNRNGWFSEIEDSPEDKEHNKKVFDLASKIEEDEWNELWDILRGQNRDEYKSIMENASEEEKRNLSLWDKWYDGSGMKHWWD